MTLRLSIDEEEMLAGKHGEAKRMAMSIVARMAEVCGAEELLPITGVHVGGCFYDGEAGLEFAEKLASLGGRVAVPTTLNMISADLERWRQFRVPAEYADKASRLAEAYLAMGAEPTFTCAPYESAFAPRFGDQVAWAESNAIVYANSVTGARTNRYGDLLDICLALAGRAPKYGLHLAENRHGGIFFRLRDVPSSLAAEEWFGAALGYVVGRMSGGKIPIVGGAPAGIGREQLKAFGAAAASSGAVALFHIAGITPECPQDWQATHGNSRLDVHDISDRDIRRAYAELSTGDVNRPDLVVIGCPHLSISMAERLAGRLAGRKVRPGTEFWVNTNRAVYSALEKAGRLGVFQEAGVRTTTDTCPLNHWVKEWGFASLMTNSAKLAHYAPGTTGLGVRFGGMDECVAEGTVRAS